MGRRTEGDCETLFALAQRKAQLFHSHQQVIEEQRMKKQEQQLKLRNRD